MVPPLVIHEHWVLDKFGAIRMQSETFVRFGGSRLGALSIGKGTAMTDDAFTTRSDEPMSEDTAAEEPEQPIVDSSAETADEGGGDGGGNGMLGPLEIPSTGRLLVGIGAAAMVLSTLFSWIESGPDSFPNATGIGSSTIGVGLAVFLVGLSLLLRAKSVAATLGLALGAFAITLIFIVLVGADAPLLGFGAWLGLAGCSVAVLGALASVYEQSEQEAEQPDLDVNPVVAALGAALAVVASFWLDWYGGSEYLEYGPLNGLDSDAKFGLPVLILGGLALVLIVELATVPRMVMEGRRQALLMICRAAGIAIVVIAGSNVLAMTVFGESFFGSAPIVALVGGVMVTRSIKEA